MKFIGFVVNYTGLFSVKQNHWWSAFLPNVYVSNSLFLDFLFENTLFHLWFVQVEIDRIPDIIEALNDSMPSKITLHINLVCSLLVCLSVCPNKKCCVSSNLTDQKLYPPTRNVFPSTWNFFPPTWNIFSTNLKLFFYTFEALDFKSDLRWLPRVLQPQH